MRFVERPSEPPDGFEDRARDEYDKVVDHRGDPTKTKSFGFKVYKRDEVKRVLHDTFHGKCAYCETFYAATQPMDVEHFRPKGAVAGEDHPGYWWLAMKWDNLLPSCIDCNRKRKQLTLKVDVRQVLLMGGGAGVGAPERRQQSSGKKDSFPIAGTGVRATEPGPTARDELADPASPGLEGEHALLLNPCVEEPGVHLEHYFSALPPGANGTAPPPVSLILPARLADDGPVLFRGDDDLSLKGAASIHVYGLNRLDLVQARTELLRRLEFLKTIVVQLHTLAEDMDAVLAAAGLPNETRTVVEKAGRMVRSLADEVVGEIARLTDDNKPYCSMVRSWRAAFEDELVV